MKIMQVNIVYPNASTGKIVKDIHTQLIKDKHESIVCYGRGKRISENNVYKIAPELIMKMQSLESKLTGYAYAGSYYSTHKLINMIKKEQPDVVHLQCINAYIVNIFKLLDFLKLNNIPTVLTLHAEFMYTAGCGIALDCEKWRTGCGNCPQRSGGRPASKLFDRSAEEWKLMQKSYEGFDNLVITSVSGWLHEKAKQSPFFLDKKMKIVLNGIDTKNTFKPTDYKELKKKYSVKNEKVLLHVTANFNDPIKGGRYVIELAERLKHKNIKIFIIGFNGDQNKLPKNVVPIKQITNQKELAQFYSMADLTILTSVKETFSMICAESLSCGTPVVGFKAGGPETISIKKFSEFVEYGDIDQLEISVLKFLNNKQNHSKEISKKARELYCKEKMYKGYLEIYEESMRCKEN